MTSLRALTRLTACAVRARPSSTLTTLRLIQTPRAQQPLPRLRAFTSAPPQPIKYYNYPEVKSLSEQPSADRVLVDVREPSEFEGGAIPTAVNVPIASCPDALVMPAHEFEDKFGFEKPRVDQEVVFYCKAGVRSHAAAEVARQAGYPKVAEYRGSWLDWVKNGGGN